MTTLVEVRAAVHYFLFVRYSDGARGEVDLSDLVGRGVFAPLADESRFAQARLSSSGEISWGDGMELCPDTVYLRLTGKAPEEVFPRLAAEVSHA